MLQVIKPDASQPPPGYHYSPEDYEKLIDSTELVLEWRNGDKPLAHVGLIRPNLMANEIFLWLILLQSPLSFREVMAGMREAHNYLNGLGARLYAEVDKALPQNKKLLIVLGFEKVADFPNREMYWR